MKAVIIYPKSGKESFERVPVPREPLGACSISAALNQKGHEAKVFHQLGTDNELVKWVTDYKPDIVCFSTMTYNFDHGRYMAERVKRTYRDVPIIFGGCHVSGCAAHWNQYPELLEDILRPPIDFIVIREGEETIVELADALEAKMGIENIKGIAYRYNGRIQLSKPRPRIRDLDQLPFPDRENLPFEKYTSQAFRLSGMGNNMATQHGARGCRYACTFCVSPVVCPGAIRARSVKKFIDETQILIETYNVGTIYFADEDFFYSQRRIIDLCKEITNRNLQHEFSWFCFANVTDITHNTSASEELLQLMKKAGCHHLFIGIESTNLRTLEKIHKGITFEEMKIACSIVRNAGLGVWGSVMTGYPWEERDELLISLERVKELPLDYIYFVFLTPFPGTSLFEYCKEHDLLITEDFSKYDTTEPIIKTCIHVNELEKMLLRKKIEYYTNKNHIKLMLENIRKDPSKLIEYEDFYNGEFQYFLDKMTKLQTT